MVLPLSTNDFCIKLKWIFMKLHFISLGIMLINWSAITAQYNSNSELASRINILDQRETTVDASVIATTYMGRQVFLVTLGRGDMDNKPGIAVIGGIQGPSLVSTEITMQMTEKIIDQHPDMLDEVTLNFIPALSPDASEQYFEEPVYERERNGRPYDDDRDGLTDEDGYDDLNHDGLITWMRIQDPDKGEFMVHPDHPSVMVKADPAKNQQAEYIVIREGIDNDKDGSINEDLPGGVILSKNFSYDYPYFEDGAGEDAFSEEENRALAKFLFDQWNVFAILCIGPENNLTEYTDLRQKFADQRIPSAINDRDKVYYESVVNLYQKLVHLNDSSLVLPKGGDILSWAYFHYNRFSFSTPAWNVSKNKNDMGSVEFDYLQWASDHELQDQTVAWQEIEHPDYPDKIVEVGGIKPFLALNPPLSLIDSAVNQHVDFLIALADMHPALVFNEVKVTERQGNIYMIEAELTNTGKFPTMPALATGSKWVKKIRLDISTSEDQEVTGGREVFLYDRIDPGETVKANWLIKGRGKVSLKAGSPQTGYISRDIELN